ncbi:MAG: hypothetical protein ABUJ98_14165 [Hyphomicrobium sp.]
MRTETFEQDGKPMERVIIDEGKTIVIRAAKPAGEPLARPKKMAEEKPTRRAPPPEKSRETT